MKNMKILSKASAIATSTLLFSNIAYAGIEISKPDIDDGIITTVGKFLGAIQWIGIVVAIVMVLWVGIKYVTAGAGTKAEVKKDLIPMLVGAALIGLAIPIVKGVITMLNKELATMMFGA